MNIRYIALFKGLESSELKRIESLAVRRNFKKGEILFMEGDKPEHLWFILEGEVKVFKEYASGKSAILGIFDKGAMVAEIAVIDGRPYPASCQAITEGSAALLKRDDALDVITSNPAVSLKLMVAIGRKLRELTGDLGSMAVQTVIRRLSRLLLKLADKFGVRKGNKLEVELFLTRKDLAECIGTSFEVAVRSLGKLQSDGVLEIHGKRVVILNPARLAEIADEE